MEPSLALLSTQNWHLPGAFTNELHCLQNPYMPTKHCSSLRESRLYEEELVFHLGGDIFTYSRPLNLQKLHWSDSPLNLFFFLWLCWVFVTTCGLPLVVTSGGYSLAVVRGLLIGGVSLVAEHGLQTMGFTGCGAGA